MQSRRESPAVVALRNQTTGDSTNLATPARAPGNPFASKVGMVQLTDGRRRKEIATLQEQAKE